ncbi:MAG: hypothetical protein HYV35_07780 [Lentisphaerae bacterium]|nr:hypothetical protein [Lentisphaerota bacterium]
MKPYSIGLLPLYLELYDRSFTAFRPCAEAFYQDVAQGLRRQGLEVVTAPVCRLAAEFKRTIASFEKARVDALVTLHLAYSPSLESAAELAATRLPLIVLDTTPDFDFGPRQLPDKLMYNHGIHGVQDMCNLLRRNGKPFIILAGHWQKSDVLKRVAQQLASARMALSLRAARVGRIGEPFKGMGDFTVPERVLKALGVTTIPSHGPTIKRLVAAIRPAEIEAELSADRQKFSTAGLSAAAHRRSVLVGLAIRRWIRNEHLGAFTFNFLAINRHSGFATVPFLEASKAMARGLGYAGEGDVLTAALTGALMSAYPATTFTEMFCPDWKGNRIFLSHMGEVNLNLLAGRPRLQKAGYKLWEAEDPVMAVGCLRGGAAVLVNLAPLAARKFRLIVAPVTMQTVRGRDNMKAMIHGWFRSLLPVADFLAAYSRAGGTHHAALVYGSAAPQIIGFGELMGWDTMVLA